ncbi:MAG: AAA family ATPase [Blastocatellia bacterium]
MQEEVVDNPGAPGAMDRRIAYSTSWGHLVDEMRRLDLLMRLCLMTAGHRHPESPLDQFRGLVITEEEVAGLIADLPNAWAEEQSFEPDTVAQPLIETFSQLTSHIQARREASLDEGIILSLPVLTNLFQLTPFEEQCLLICLAPELDRRYEKLYAYLHDDVTRKKPSVDLLLNLLCLTKAERLTARWAFEHRSPLLRYRLLQMTDNGPEGPTPLLSRQLKVDDRIVNYLLEITGIDKRLESVARLIDQPRDWEEVMETEWIEERTRERMRRFLDVYLDETEADSRQVVFYIHGPDGIGKQALAEAVADELGLPLLIGDARKMLAQAQPFDEVMLLLGREAALQPAVLCLEQAGALFADEDRERDHWRALCETAQTFSHVTLLLGRQFYQPPRSSRDVTLIEIAMPMPGDAARKECWETAINGRLRPAADIDPGALAGKFRFTPGQVQAAIDTALSQARWCSPGDERLTMSDLHAACRAQSGRKIGALARKIGPRYAWSDIVLPEDSMAQLREICQRVARRHRVLGEWGFDRKLSLGKGVNALFAGPSGTGKTMAAEIIANELGLDLYQIDLSGVVSKYIGETEKNLDAIFTAAESANAILFFDEADALFGKRSEVRDSHDRYANIEISYLLQKMEAYEGVAILATNLRQNLDDSFVRRLAFTIHFPFPDEADRGRIWAGIWPAETPLAGDVDFGLLAHRFKLSGGNIKNIALAAAFLAAEDGGVVKMPHLLQATRREYQKLGKPLSVAELGAFAREAGR